MNGHPCIFLARVFMAFLLVPTFAAAGQKVEIKTKPGQNFEKFRSYAWGENVIAPGQVPEERARIEGVVKDVVNRELAGKGYAEDPQNPDFFIAVKAGAIPGDVATSANPDLRVPAGADITIYSSHDPGVRVWMTLVAGVRIVVTDGATGETAWEAEASKKYKNPEKLSNNLDKEIDQVFKKALKDFPRRKN